MPEHVSRRTTRDRNLTYRKGDARHEAILDSAEHQLAEVGAGRLSIDAVARGAGLSRPSLYFYFSSKAELIAALFARAQGEIFAPVGDAVDREAGLDAVVRPALEQAVRRWRDHGPVLSAGIELSATMPEVREQYDTAVVRLVDAVTLLVVRHGPRGDIEPDGADLREVVEALVLMSERGLHRLFSAPHPRRAERRLVDVLELLWLRGLGVVPLPVNPAHQEGLSLAERSATAGREKG
jgi:TetR/AcrR family transcriptional regulator, ethionamide resistance regulator